MQLAPIARRTGIEQGATVGNGVLAFLAGAGAGYLKQRDIEEDRALRKEDRAFLAEERSRKRKEWGKEDALQSGLENAAGKADVVEGELGDQSMGPPMPIALMPKSGNSPLPNPATEPLALSMTRPDTMDNRDVGLSENENLPNRGLNIAQMLGNSPESENSPNSGPNMAQMMTGQAQGSPMKYRTIALGGHNQTYDSKEAAQAAADAYNKPDAMGQRVTAAYQNAGKFKDAFQMESEQRDGKLKQLQLEKAIEDRANEKFDGDLFSAGANKDSLAKFLTGSPLVGGGKVSYTETPDGKIQFMTVGADGNPRPLAQPLPNDPQAWTPLLATYAKGLTPSQKITHLHSFAQHNQSQDNWNKDFTLKQNSENRQDRVAETQIRKTELDIQGLIDSNKMPTPVKFQAEGLRTQMNTIAAAIAKAQAEDRWQHDSPGAKDLLTQQGVLRGQMNLLLAPYLKEGGAKPDPLGFRGGAAPSTAPSTAPVNGGKKQWDSQQAHDERVQIIESELNKALIAGNQQDVEALQRELKGLGVPVVAQTANNPAQKPQAKPNVIQQQAQTPAKTEPMAPATAVAPAKPSGAPAMVNGGMQRGLNMAQILGTTPESESSPNRGPNMAQVVGTSPVSLGDDFESPGARKALAERVVEALNGGAPLSRIETLRAQQLNLLRGK
jgi:hypothetical protein